MILVDSSRGFLFFLIVFIIAFQYRRISQTEERLYGVPKNQVIPQVLSSTAYGLLGGALGSLIMVFVGVSLSFEGIAYLWPLALLLMLVNPRFMCFSYAGGIISVSNLLFGWPKVDVPGLVALIGVLHVTEAILIRFSGGTCLTPMTIRNKHGEVVSGFSLQKFWPVPIVVLMLMTSPEISKMTGLIKMPDWWPLLRPDGVTSQENVLYIMLPVIAALGYGDIAITLPPSEKLKKTSLYLSLYSLTLLVLAILSSWIRPLRWAAAFLAPIGHEAVIWAGMRGELTEEPYLKYRDGQVTVFDVLPHSPAHRAGLRSNDIILQVNGEPVFSESDLKNLISGGLHAFHFLIRRYPEYGKEVHPETFYIRVEGFPGAHLGFILVPDGTSSTYVELKRSMPSRQILGFFRRLLKRDGGR